MFTSLCQQTGVNVFNIYSNRLVTIINSTLPFDKQVKANFATQIYGVFGFFNSCISFKTNNLFNRKTILLVGQFTMGTTLLFFALSIKLQEGAISICLMLLFNFFMMTTIGAVHWIYISEILTDVQFGFISTCHYCNGIEVSLISEWMFNKLRPDGTFVYYGCITLVGFFLIQHFLKETKGLTDTDKKMLYWPEKYKQAKVVEMSPQIPFELELSSDWEIKSDH